MTYKTKKNWKVLEKKLSYRIRIFYSELPYETSQKLSFYRLYSIGKTKLIPFLASNAVLYTFFIENTLIGRKITLKVNKIMPSIPCSHKTSIINNSSQKIESQKNLFNFEFYAGRAFQWYHSHFSTMNISIGRICRNKKNPFEYIVPPPASGVGTKMFKNNIPFHLANLHSYRFNFNFPSKFVYISWFSYNGKTSKIWKFVSALFVNFENALSNI